MNRFISLSVATAAYAVFVVIGIAYLPQGKLNGKKFSRLIKCVFIGIIGALAVVIWLITRNIDVVFTLSLLGALGGAYLAICIRIIRR
ncbi:hypothetical protein OBV_p-00530 (plasmid) [Oscillibacter valericigenes Sjm18-20]|nr:hypothetical protein OBV_p-00530 [Oscillibacter valericigenes Sjm18-20]